MPTRHTRALNELIELISVLEGEENFGREQMTRTEGERDNPPRNTEISLSSLPSIVTLPQFSNYADLWTSGPCCTISIS